MIWEATQATRFIVSNATSITGGLAPATLTVFNPVGLWTAGARVGTRGDIGLFGYQAQAGFAIYNPRSVIGSRDSQIVTWISQVANANYNVSFHGKLIKDDVDTHARLVV